MIRTAIPFGYSFIALFLFAMFAVGVGALLLGWRRRSRIARWLGGGMAATAVVVVLGDIAFDAALEWNPKINGDSEVLGTWADDGEMITLASDNTFNYRAPSHTITGRWRREDWNLYLHGDDYSNTMRFVRFIGHYRLMTHPPEDPDLWDGKLGLRQQR